MDRSRGYVERGGTGRGTYWTLAPEVHARLAMPGHPERDRRLDWEAMKTRVLSVLKQRGEREGGGGLSNREIRQITHLDRNQVYRLMLELRKEQDGVGQLGKGRGARYVWQGTNGEENGSFGIG